MDKVGGWAKLKEIVRVSGKYRLPDAQSLTDRLLADAERFKSNSPFRRVIANDGAEAAYLALEYNTILAHVRFAEKLEFAVFRGAPDEYLPGFEPSPFEFSESAVEARILAFLEKRGITLKVLERAIEAIDFHDIDSIVEVLKAERRFPLGEEEFRKCLRLLGECGISVRASRRKTYAVRRPRA